MSEPKPDYGPTHARGFEHGRPDGRQVEPLDRVIEKVINKIPAATRLYPDVYSWKVAEAVKKYYAAQEKTDGD
jgi:hypothetical protein